MSGCLETCAAAIVGESKGAICSRHNGRDSSLRCTELWSSENCLLVTGHRRPWSKGSYVQTPEEWPSRTHIGQARFAQPDQRMRLPPINDQDKNIVTPYQHVRRNSAWVQGGVAPLKNNDFSYA
jgi:hypothetical protein